MEILLVLILILLNGIFAMSEMALVSSKRIKLQQLIDKGSIGAAKAAHLQEKPEHFISTIQVGITVIGILNGIVGEKSLVEPVSLFVQNLFGLSLATSQTISSVGIIVFLTYLTVVFGEIIPKRIGLMLPERIASILAIPIDALSKATLPIVWLFTTTSVVILKLFKLDNIQQAPVSNEEIKELMGQGADAGVFHESEKQLVANVLHMDEKKVETIMTHRAELFYVDIEDSFKDNIEKIIQGKYSRIVVVKENIDNILGILHMTDILQALKNNESFKLEDYMKAPLYLPETIMTSQVLENFKRKKTEFAIIVNEYGENIGVVTLVDIMEAIVGDIVTDESENNPEIKQRDGFDNSYFVDGLITLDRLSSFLEKKEEDIPVSEGINTLAGLIMEYAGAIPHTGYKLEIKIKDLTISLEVADMDKNCVDKVIMTVVKTQEEIVE
jgi:putative hemolysin